MKGQGRKTAKNNEFKEETIKKISTIQKRMKIRSVSNVAWVNQTADSLP
jgi:hypothetical protein